MRTFEEILVEKMDEPVPLKGKPGESVLPMEAMVMAVMNKAMKGDIASINFIENLTARAKKGRK